MSREFVIGAVLLVTMIGGPTDVAAEETREDIIERAAIRLKEVCGRDPTEDEKSMLRSVMEEGSWNGTKENGVHSQVSASIVRLLLSEIDGEHVLGEGNIRLRGVRFGEKVDLTGVSLSGEMDFADCRFDKGIVVERAAVGRLSFRNCRALFLQGRSLVVEQDFTMVGTWIEGDLGMADVEIGKNVLISGDSEVFGIVLLNYCDVKGRIDFSRFMVESDIVMRHGSVGDGVSLGEGFVCEGEIDFSHSEIRDVLRMEKARLLASNATTSFSFRDGNVGTLQVVSSELLKGANLGHLRVDGTIRVSGECFEKVVLGPNKDGTALNFGNVRSSEVRLEWVSVSGVADLGNAVIEGRVFVSDCTVENPNAVLAPFTAELLRADSFTVRGQHTWIRGTVELHGAQIRGQLNILGSMGGGPFGLDLSMADVGTLKIDRACWPEKGLLDVDGLKYKSIRPLRRSRHRHIDFLDRNHTIASQPYEQLAAVLRARGSYSDAKDILIVKERLIRKAVNEKNGIYGWIGAVWDSLLRNTAGYGHRPERFVPWFVGAVFLAFLFFRGAYRVGRLVPKNRTPNDKGRDGNGGKSENESGEAGFVAVVYACDMLLPFNLGYYEKFEINMSREMGPDSDEMQGEWWRWRKLRLRGWMHREWGGTLCLLVRCFFVSIGWIGALLLVAALAGWLQS